MILACQVKILFDLISQVTCKKSFVEKPWYVALPCPAQEMLESGVSMSLCWEVKAEMVAEGGKKFLFFFFLFVKNRISKQIAWKMLVRTVWSQHLLGFWRVISKEQLRGQQCHLLLSFLSTLGNVGLLATCLFSKQSCFSLWKILCKNQGHWLNFYNTALRQRCTPAKAAEPWPPPGEWSWLSDDQSPGGFVARNCRMVCVGRELKWPFSSKPPAMDRTFFTRPGCSRPSSSLVLSNSRDGAAASSLGNLCQCPNILTGINFFPISNLNLPCYFEAILPCPNTPCPCQRSPSSSL